MSLRISDVCKAVYRKTVVTRGIQNCGVISELDCLHCLY